MPAQYLLGLKCEGCGRESGLIPQNICEFDFGPLRVQYDYARIAKAVSRELFGRREPDMWKYIEFLPINSDQKPETSLGTGYTPLIRAKNLARALGIEAKLYIKDDRANPTHSFKDRVVETAVAKAKEFGYDAIACVSTGNLGNAVAAHAARAGLKAYILIPCDLEQEKIRGTAIFNPVLVGVRGTYDQVNRLGTELADKHEEIAFANINIRPYYGEGSKTMGYEIAEQLGWTFPGHVVIPTAGASLITKVPKAFQELHITNLVDHKPKTKVYSAQAAGCAPVANAIINGWDHIRPIPPEQINTIAKSLAIGNPADGYVALQIIRDSGGFAAAVTDKEIIEGVELLAQTEGIWGETAAGVTVASAKKLIKQGKIPINDGSIVLLITGDGYKTPDANSGQGLDSVINPTTAEFDRTLQSLEERLQ
jgi:threonine synthase